ncbi:MAG: DUF3592 domain-containing protein [Candidatus Saccharibacteria bacterium]
MALLLAVAALCIWLGIRQFGINKKRNTEGIVVKARVIRVVEYPRQRGGTYFRPVVQFTTQKGETITAEPENSPPQENFTIGEEFDIVYLPDNPNSFTTTNQVENYVAPVGFIAVGVICLGIFVFEMMR